MRNEWIDICIKYEVDPSGTFIKNMEKIYYTWDKEMLQEFMNSLLAVETKIGETLFDK